ncbi:MAG: hypothetical protein ACRYE9_01930 [Janthinobacterium lividum]
MKRKAASNITQTSNDIVNNHNEAMLQLVQSKSRINVENVEQLQTLQTLERLVFSGIKLDVYDARTIANFLKINSSLTELKLHSTYIGAAGAKEIAERLKSNNTLTILDLYANNIGEDGAKEIAEVLKSNNTLTELNLGMNFIRAAGAKEIAEGLKSNNTLNILNLFSNNIEVAGAKEIAERLKSNNTLTELNLSFNHIGDAGAKEIAEGLKSNNALTRLKLGLNMIGAAGAEEIANLLKVSKYLGVDGIDNIVMSQLNNEHKAAYEEMVATIKRVIKQLTIADKYIGDAHDIVEKAKAVSSKDLHSLLQDEACIKLLFENVKLFSISFIANSSKNFGSSTEESSSNYHITSIEQLYKEMHKHKNGYFFTMKNVGTLIRDDTVHNESMLLSNVTKELIVNHSKYMEQKSCDSSNESHDSSSLDPAATNLIIADAISANSFCFTSLPQEAQQHIFSYLNLTLNDNTVNVSGTANDNITEYSVA